LRQAPFGPLFARPPFGRQPSTRRGFFQSTSKRGRARSADFQQLTAAVVSERTGPFRVRVARLNRHFYDPDLDKGPAANLRVTPAARCCLRLCLCLSVAGRFGIVSSCRARLHRGNFGPVTWHAFKTRVLSLRTRRAGCSRGCVSKIVSAGVEARRHAGSQRFRDLAYKTSSFDI